MANSIKSIKGITPFDNTDTMAQITIDKNNVCMPLANLLDSGDYTLTLYIKADTTRYMDVVMVKTPEDYNDPESSVKTVECSNEWQKISFTFNAPLQNLTISLQFNKGTYYLYHAKLENGNKATAYSKAESDDTDYLEKKIIEMSSSFTVAMDSISSRVTKTEQRISGTEENLSKAESEIKQTAEAITSKVSKDDVISEINQSAEKVKIKAEKIDIEGAVTFDSLDSRLQNTIDNTENWADKNDVTKINGGNIQTNSIKADSIDVENLFAQNIEASGSIKGLELISPLLNNGEGVNAYINPTIEQIHTINDYITKGGTIDKNLYDINGDGNVSVLDMIILNNIIKGTKSVEDYPRIAKKSNVKFAIDSNNPSELFKIFGTNLWGQYIEAIFGIDRLKIQRINSSENYFRNITQTFQNGDQNPFLVSDGQTEYLKLRHEYNTQSKTTNYIFEINGKRALYSGNNGIVSFQNADTYMEVATTSGAKGITWWSSDSRLKKNIEDTEINALELVDKIQHKKFDWKDENIKSVKLGYVAHELQELDEDLVFAVKQPEGSEYDDLLQIDHTHVIPYLSKAIQELHEIVKNQQAQINDLKEQISNANNQKND